MLAFSTSVRSLISIVLSSAGGSHVPVRESRRGSPIASPSRDKRVASHEHRPESRVASREPLYLLYQRRRLVGRFRAGYNIVESVPLDRVAAGDTDQPPDGVGGHGFGRPGPGHVV